MWLTLLIGILGWIVFSFLYFFFINLFFTEAYSPNPKYNDIDNEFMSIFLIIFSIFWCYFCELPLANSIIYISFFIIAHNGYAKQKIRISNFCRSNSFLFLYSNPSVKKLGDRAFYC